MRVPCVVPRTLLAALAALSAGCAEVAVPPAPAAPPERAAAATSPAGWVAVTAGAQHACALTPAGEAYCWGDNPDGRLGDGTRVRRLLPVRAAPGMTFTAIGAGSMHTCALDAGGSAWCWGSNARWALGSGGTLPDSPTPKKVASNAAFTALAVGSQHACALASGGQTYCWGSNVSGQIGDGTFTDRNGAVASASGFTFARLAAGYDHTCAMTGAAAAYCWGWNHAGQRGDGVVGGGVPSAVPVAVAGGRAFQRLAGGMSHSCGVTSASQAFCWGWDGSGEIGTGSITGLNHWSPAAVAGSTAFKAVAAGTNHSCGLDAGQQARCWGGNLRGELGDGGSASRGYPAPVALGYTYSAIDAGAQFTCALRTADRQAYCWGRNDVGQLGNGGTLDKRYPGLVP